MEREQSGKPFNDVVKCSQDLWHCISPDFLENQISLSLQRLNLEKIDVYLLHNPEYFLTYSIISDPERREREYYRRIKDAFIHLKKKLNAEEFLTTEFHQILLLKKKLNKILLRWKKLLQSQMRFQNKIILPLFNFL